jgi:protein O-GlcNAc transferase
VSNNFSQAAHEAQQAGDFLQADKLYQAWVELHPTDAVAYARWALVAKAMDQTSLAYQRLEKAILLTPNQAELRALLGQWQLGLNQFAQAVSSLQQALRLDSRQAQWWYWLGYAQHELGHRDLAIQAYYEALQLQPRFYEAANNLGIVFDEISQGDEAVKAFRLAVDISPINPSAWKNLGQSLQKIGQADKALAAFNQSLKLAPRDATLLNAIGSFYLSVKQPEQALQYFESALSSGSTDGELLFNVALAYQQLNRPIEAIHCYEQASLLSPRISRLFALSLRQQRLLSPSIESDCREAMQEYVRRLPHGNPVPISPFTILTLPVTTTGYEQRVVAEYWSSKMYAAVRRLAPRSVSQSSPIRLGYLSPDFRSHPVTVLVAELFEKHDRQKFHVSAYALGPPDESDFRHRIVSACDRFIDIEGYPASRVTQQFGEDQIDILIDLGGYTKNSRAELLAMKSVPIQVNYLGYPSTMGSDFVDYIMVDEHVVPTGQEMDFAEKLVYLPGCYQANSMGWQIAAEPTRAEVGLPEGRFVFACFNSPYKITTSIFEIWMRLLLQLPEAVLWLLESEPSMVQSLRERATFHGVDPSRVYFAPFRSLPEHLARQPLADVVLDCFPVNAHTTASDALRMGMPLVTLSGSTFVSRVAGSLLKTLGLDELIASTAFEYESIALRLAREPDYLRAATRRTSTKFALRQFASCPKD